MLNTHTITRQFRENCFDIRAFLEVLHGILNHISTHSADLLEIKWSDGSVDLVPTVDLIKSIVSSVFSSIEINNYNFIPMPNNNLQLDGYGISAHFDNIDNPDFLCTLISCLISSLESSSVVIKDPKSKVRLGQYSDLGTDYLEVNDLSCNALSYNSIDVSNEFYVPMGSYFHVKTNYSQVSNSQMLCHCAITTDSVARSIAFTGKLCLADKNDSGDLYDTYKNRFSHDSRYRVGIVFDNTNQYVYSNYQYFSSDGIDSNINNTPYLKSLYLYPKLNATYRLVDDSYDTYTFFVENLEPKDKYTIVEVKNTSTDYISATNVWEFGSSSDIAYIHSLNTVTLPPYSRIDFLLTYDDLGDNTRVVKMLPMSYMSTNWVP